MHAIFAVARRREVYTRGLFEGTCSDTDTWGWNRARDQMRSRPCPRRHAVAWLENTPAAVGSNTNRKQIRSQVATVAVAGYGARNDIRPCVKHRRRIQSVSLSGPLPEGPSREDDSSSPGLGRAAWMSNFRKHPSVLRRLRAWANLV